MPIRPARYGSVLLINFNLSSTLFNRLIRFIIMFNKLAPKTYSKHYPRWMVGKPLLYMSSALASLGVRTSRHFDLTPETHPMLRMLCSVMPQAS